MVLRLEIDDSKRLLSHPVGHLEYSTLLPSLSSLPEYRYQHSEAASSTHITAVDRPTLTLRQPSDGILCVEVDRAITRIML